MARRRPTSLPILAALTAMAMAVLGAAVASSPATAAGKGRSVKAGTSKADPRVGLHGNVALRARCRSGEQLRRLRRQRPARRLRRSVKRCAAKARPSTVVPNSIYWGAWIGDQLTGEQAPWDMSAVSKLEEMAAKNLSMVHFAAPFANCASACYFYDFPTGPMDDIREHGAIPFFSWSSQSIPSTTSEPDFQLSDVIAGTYDDYIREFAEDSKRWGNPYFMRFNWEMNGNWFPWSESVNGNGAGEYVAAWRHVHDIFASVGADNATWVWCPNVDPESRFQDLSSVYPGHEYVDWTCLDGYNWGTNSAKQTGWMSFDRVYRSTYDLVTEQIAPGKPMVIGEIGSSERGGSKAGWISDALSKVTTDYAAVRGFLYFEKYDDGMDWPIETSASAVAAFAEGIQSPAFASNAYAAVAASPIPPPS